MLAATPAVAQFGLPNISRAARLLNDAARGPNHGAPRGRSSHHSRSDASEESQSSTNKSTNDAEATRRRLAALEELGEILRAEKMEHERNVDTAVNTFIKELADRHAELLKRADRAVRATRGEINQVTAGQVKASVEDAYEQAKLREFEKFTGELWTRDRLLVRILRYAEKRLSPYFVGVGAKGPSADDLKDLFQRSARDVYAKALETTEIIGVSKSFDRFIRTIYEQSDGANAGLWTIGADGKYEWLTSLSIDALWRQNSVQPLTGAIVADKEGLDRQFLYRYRARRTLYDCLARTYPELVRGGGTMTAGYTTTTPAPQPRGFYPVEGKNGAAGAVAGEGLWVKVRDHVGKACHLEITRILDQAMRGSIGPVSSREPAVPAQGPAMVAGERR
jgi:hypothetical protein